MFKKTFQFRIIWVLEILFVVAGLIVVVLFQRDGQIGSKNIPDDAQPTVQKSVPEKETVSAQEVEPISLIESAVFCLDVDGNAPVLVKSRFSSLVDRVYCFVSFSQTQTVRQTIYHRWIYKNRIMYEQEFPIGPSQTKTWSYLDMSPEYKGEWRVKVMDQNASVLETIGFILE